MIVSCGDAIIDMMPGPVPGGSNMNVAVAAARLGAPTAFLGRVSFDPFGELLMEHMEESGVNTTLVERGPEPTARAVVSLHPSPSFQFEADGTAEANLTIADLSPIGQGPHIVHGGTFGMYRGQTAATLAELIETNPGLISLDPNVRPSIVDDRAEWDSWHQRWLDQTSLYRCSDEDAEWIAPNRTIDSFAAELLARGIETVIVTRGGQGCDVFTSAWSEHRNGVQVDVVDTVGAGDTFTGAVLSGLHELGATSRSSLSSLDKASLLGVMDNALLASAFVCGRTGANPPWRSELRDWPNRFEGARAR
ncbi:MAG: carbohydrate kinase [Actinomycetia bacterium]|nr:carbohydrate kinase [Actinomycetes bacterium]